jgi:hypothetical protein
MSDIPEWAVKRATDLTSEAMKDGSWLPIGGHASAAFARYIAEHEEPPVDPLLIEAREIASQVRRGVATDSQSMNGTVSANIRDGKFDDHQLVKSAYRALRRGMELGREQSK